MVIENLKTALKDQKYKKKFYFFSGFLFFVALFVIGLLVNVKRYELSLLEQVKSQEAVLANDYDTDMDGISDWEELLLGFNPMLRDTNGDGIEDGELLLSVRALNQANENSEPSIPFEELPRTDQILRRTYAVATVLESTGNYTETEKTELVENIGKEMLVVDEYKLFTENQIKIALSNTQSTKYRYMLSMAEEISRIEILENNPAMYLLASLERDNPKILEEGMTPLINDLYSIRNNLLMIRVPAEFVNYHLTFINTIQRVIQDTEQIQRFNNDPLIAYGAIIKLGSSMNDMYEAASNMIIYIENNI